MYGGDGWAYDIGYGGLDHVLASGRDKRTGCRYRSLLQHRRSVLQGNPIGAVARLPQAVSPL